MKKMILVTIICLCATGVFAQSQPFQLSLTPEIALQPKTAMITGVTLGLWSENPQNALAFGVVNGSTGMSSGLSFGLLANYSESFEGAQLAWIANYASVSFKGLQWASFNYAERLHGLQFGFVNFAATTDKGVQVGILNIIKETNQWFQAFPDEVAPAMVLINWRF